MIQTVHFDVAAAQRRAPQLQEHTNHVEESDRDLDLRRGDSPTDSPRGSAAVPPSPTVSSNFPTPIADKFQSTFAVSPTLPSFSSTPGTGCKPAFIPSRHNNLSNGSAGSNSLFVNRAQAPGSARSSPKPVAFGPASEPTSTGEIRQKGSESGNVGLGFSVQTVPVVGVATSTAARKPAERRPVFGKRASRISVGDI